LPAMNGEPRNDAVAWTRAIPPVIVGVHAARAKIKPALTLCNQG
jgi:hypothetical protein